MRVHVRLWCVVSAAAGSVAGKRGKLAASALLRAPLIRRCVFVCLCVCVCVSPPPLHWAALRASLATRARYAWRYVHTTHTAPSACSSEARLFFFLRYFCLEYRLDSLSLSSLFAYLFERARARGRERRAHPPPLLFLFPIQLFSLSLSVPSFHIYVHTKTPNFVGWL